MYANRETKFHAPCQNFSSIALVSREEKERNLGVSNDNFSVSNADMNTR